MTVAIMRTERQSLRVAALGGSGRDRAIGGAMHLQLYSYEDLEAAYFLGLSRALTLRKRRKPSGAVVVDLADWIRDHAGRPTRTPRGDTMEGQ